MANLGAAFRIFGRTWKRALALGGVLWLPLLLFAALAVLALFVSDRPAENFGLGVVIWLFGYAPFADQLLSLVVFRAERAHAMGVRPSTLREPRSLGWATLTALIVTGFLVATSFFFLVSIVLVPFVFVSTLAAGVEQRALPSALARGFRLSKGFRWKVIGAMFLLWAARWAVSGALTGLVSQDDHVPMAIAIGVAALFNVVASAIFASLMVAFYRDMIVRHDAPAEQLGKIFE